MFVCCSKTSRKQHFLLCVIEIFIFLSCSASGGSCYGNIFFYSYVHSPHDKNMLVRTYSLREGENVSSSENFAVVLGFGTFCESVQILW